MTFKRDVIEWKMFFPYLLLQHAAPSLCLFSGTCKPMSIQNPDLASFVLQKFMMCFCMYTCIPICTYIEN